MSFTNVNLSNIPFNLTGTTGYAYLAYDVESGFKLFEEVITDEVTYFKDITDSYSTSSLTELSASCVMRNSILRDISGATDPFAGLDLSISQPIRVGSVWAAISGYVNSSNLLLDRTFTPPKQVTVSSSIFSTYRNHGYTAGDKVAFSSSGTLPSGITADTVYYVITSNLADKTFQVSATSGGSAVSITDSGDGTHKVHTVSAVSVPIYTPDIVNETIVAKIGRSNNTYTIEETYYNVNNTLDRQIEVVSGLPEFGDYEGQTVIDSSTNTIYTWNGFEWVQGTGTDARTVKLTTNVQAFDYDAEGNLGATTGATLTATAYNTVGDVYYEFIIDGITVQNTTANTYSYSAQAVLTDMPDIAEVKIREGNSAGTVLASDLLTLFGVRPGTDAITIVVSNEAHSIYTDQFSNEDYTGSGTTIKVYKGATLLSYDDTVTYADPSFRVVVNTASGITAGAVSGTGTTCTIADHSNLTQDQAYITYDVIVTDGGIETTYIKTQSFSRSQDGLDGAQGADGSVGLDARSVRLTTGQQVFSYTAAGALEGTTSTTITASPYNTTGTVTYEFYLNDVSTGAASATATYSYSAQAAFSSMPDKVEVNMYEDGTLVATDIITIYGIRNAGDAVTVILSNEAHTVPADSSGTVTSYSGSGTTIRVFEGVTELTYDGVGTSNGTWTLSSSATGITVGSVTDSGSFATVGNHSGMSTNIVPITYTITGKRADGTAIDIDKIQTITKSVAGSDGSQGPTGSQGTGGSQGASGTQGVQGIGGPQGVVGTTGPGARTAYIIANSNYAFSGTQTRTISGDNLPGNYWNITQSSGNTTTWSSNPQTLSSSGTSLYQVNGLYNSSTNQTTWYGYPFLSNLRVGTLSAITANMGTVTTGLLRNSSSTFGVNASLGVVVNFVGSVMKVVGSGFGVSSDLVEWYGPKPTGASVSDPKLSTLTKTNGYWAQASDGKVYYGTSELLGGGTSAFNVSVSGTYVKTYNAPTTLSWNDIVATVSNGSGSYSYQWGLFSGTDMGMTLDTTAQPNFSKAVTTGDVEGRYQLIVTDNNTKAVLLARITILAAFIG